MNGSKPDRLGDEQGLANPDANAQAQTRVVFPLAPALSPRRGNSVRGRGEIRCALDRPLVGVSISLSLGERAGARGKTTRV